MDEYPKCPVRDKTNTEESPKNIPLHLPVSCWYYASLLVFQNHWFTYNERMSVESVTQAVSNLALQFGDDDADPGAMVGLIKFDCVKLKLL